MCFEFRVHTSCKFPTYLSSLIYQKCDIFLLFFLALDDVISNKGCMLWMMKKVVTFFFFYPHNHCEIT